LAQGITLVKNKGGTPYPNFLIKLGKEKGIWEPSQIETEPIIPWE